MFEIIGRIHSTPLICKYIEYLYKFRKEKANKRNKCFFTPSFYKKLFTLDCGYFINYSIYLFIE